MADQKKKPYFLITIDTEGDNMWRQLCRERDRKRITVKNGEYMERFQNLCEKYNFIPTYLVDYEMTRSTPFVEMARDKLGDGRLEIGMHMHGWTTPPGYELRIAPGYKGNPYINEYPVEVMKKKVACLTKTLMEVFGTRATSHRSGRWYMDNHYAAILKKAGYIVDCSVTPGISWKQHEGVTEGSRGTDYRRFPGRDYEISLKNIRKEGNSGIYEVPVSTQTVKSGGWFARKKVITLRPDGRNIKDLFYIAEEKKRLGVDYLEFMLHSSELMPGGSPNFRDRRQIDALYKEIEMLFDKLSAEYVGVGLTEYVKNKYTLSRV